MPPTSAPPRRPHFHYRGSITSASVFRGFIFPPEYTLTLLHTHNYASTKGLPLNNGPKPKGIPTNSNLTEKFTLELNPRENVTGDSYQTYQCNKINILVNHTSSVRISSIRNCPKAIYFRLGCSYNLPKSIARI